MQRFVTYIYAYDEGQKGGNTGYAKIETRGNTGRMEIHLSGAGVVRGTGEVYFLKDTINKFEYYKAGVFEIQEGAGVFQVTFQVTGVLDSGLEFEQMAGIAIKDSQGRGYLSFWKDVRQTRFEQELFVEGSQVQYEKRQLDVIEEENVKENELLEDAEQEVLHTMEIPVRNIFPKSNLADIWQVMQKNRLSVQINEEVSAIQIELKDLRELPKQYWYLGNNSFLLHGFFNYRYLLLGKLPAGGWFLGVPGVYQKQERVMAAIFGFPGFLAAGDVAEENIRELQPGAWYHVLED